MDKKEAKLKKETIEFEHKCRIKQLEFKLEILKFERETQRMFFEKQMNYHRLKRADIYREKGIK